MKDHINNIRMQRNLIAIEASIVGNLAEYFGKKIPGLVDDFKSSGAVFLNAISDSFSNDKQTSINFTGKQKKFLKSVKETNYLDLTEINVYVPEGLCVSYRVYLDTLVGMVSYCETIHTELTEFNTFISRLISDDNYQLSTDYVKSKLFKMTESIDDLIENSSKCFKKGLTATEVKLKTVVHNNSEWVAVTEELEGLVKRMEAIDKDKLKQLLKETNELLGILIPKIKKGELTRISPQMVEKMGDYTYLLAKSMEVYSVTAYRVMALETSIENSMDKLQEVISK